MNCVRTNERTKNVHYVKKRTKTYTYNSLQFTTIQIQLVTYENGATLDVTGIAPVYLEVSHWGIEPQTT